MSVNNKMIIFGAGASYGSEENNQNTPPTGEYLFGELKLFDQNGWGSISNEFAGNFRSNFEKGKIIYAKERPGELINLHKSMARYFYKFIPSVDNLYIKFAKRILNSKWQGCFATINYERLLELSLFYTGLKPIITDKKRVDIPQIELILPHGCCHFFIDKKTVYIDPNQYVEGLSVSINGPIVIAKDDSDFYNKLNSNLVPPVMSYYEPLKRTTSGSEFIKGQRKRFEEKVMESKIICIIGVKVNHNDDHIWGPLIRTKGRLIYCSGVKGGEEFKKWKKDYRDNKPDKIIKKAMLNLTIAI